jgi:serine/threonine-protein kinase
MEMKLDRRDWATVLRHLDTALDLPAAERSAWLEALALEPAALKDALRMLLEDRRAIETGDFLGAGAEASTLQAGAVLGPWRLLRPLGLGGMASVWLAEKADGAHQRQVALKLPHRVIGSTVVAERFLRERAILSTLQHPHIAQVLDAGSAAGQPWLALEYVLGLPITAHASQQGLDTRARLRLFLPVLRAVQFAHGQLVIHRDLKPANVLVAADGTVKLLDFGVAKLLEAEGAAAQVAETALTQRGGRAMTPQYASPEQVAGRPLGVTSDVYSLGVLLYELLTGRLPYTLKRDTAAALEEAILGAQVQRPSQSVADRAQARALQGDVDTLVMKALAVLPAARYASAAALAEEIERHLEHRPITARAAGWHYRAGRLLQRHVLAVGAGAAVLLALVGGAGVAAWQAERARAEARQSQAVQAFLSQVLSYNDPQQAQGHERTARELLVLAAGQIDARFAGQPDVQARLHHTVGSIFIEMGAMAPAAEHLKSALAWREQATPGGSAEAVESLYRLAQAQVELRDFASASATLARTLQAGDALGTTPHRWTGRVLAYQAWVASQQGQLERSAALGEQALRVQRAYSGERSADYLTAASHIVSNHLARGQVAQAEALLEAFEKYAPGLPDYPITDQIGQRTLLANLRYTRGDYEGAEQTLREVVPLFERHIGAQHDRTVVTRSLYARTLAELGRYAQALQEQQSNVAHLAARAQVEPEAVQLAQLQLVRLLVQAGRSDEAVALARQAVAYFDARYPRPTRYTEAARWYLAESLLAQGRREEGLRQLQASLGNAEQLGPGNNPLERASKQLSLALALRATEAARAAALATEACTVLGKALGEASPRALKCLAVRAWLQAGTAPAAEREAARAAFVRARELLLPTLAPPHLLRAELLAAEAELLALDPARGAESKALLGRADAQYRATLGGALPQPLLTLH